MRKWVNSERIYTDLVLNCYDLRWMIVFFMIVFFSAAVVFGGFSMKTVELKVNYLDTENREVVFYDTVPVFAENMRFNHNSISYFIGEDCDEKRTRNMLEAFDIFSSKVGVINFYKGDFDSDIKIECSDKHVEFYSGTKPNGLFTAGEGGPSRIIDTSEFKVVEEGKVVLYNGVDCDYPVVALHELCHVFGFDHSNDPGNIMYNTSECDQRMSDDMVEFVKELYSVEAFGDARIENVSGIVKGKYLDFNASILNEGLVGIDSVDLTIFYSKNDVGEFDYDDVVDVIDLAEIEIGYGRTLRIENMRVPFGIKRLRFVIDAGNLVEEIREDNNVVEMAI